MFTFFLKKMVNSKTPQKLPSQINGINCTQFTVIGKKIFGLLELLFLRRRSEGPTRRLSAVSGSAVSLEVESADSWTSAADNRTASVASIRELKFIRKVRLVKRLAAAL